MRDRKSHKIGLQPSPATSLSTNNSTFSEKHINHTDVCSSTLKFLFHSNSVKLILNTSSQIIYVL